ncbi:hypothetical protein PLANTIT3_60954 [Plantibacter sp. T3]|nr:hypothetical protein PLANTIT3_60954 [Plantibacter sp. T3]
MRSSRPTGRRGRTRSRRGCCLQRKSSCRHPTRRSPSTPPKRTDGGSRLVDRAAVVTSDHVQFTRHVSINTREQLCQERTSPESKPRSAGRSSTRRATRSCSTSRPVPRCSAAPRRSASPVNRAPRPSSTP